jgi:hypothetical protein
MGVEFFRAKVRLPNVVSVGTSASRLKEVAGVDAFGHINESLNSDDGLPHTLIDAIRKSKYLWWKGLAQVGRFQGQYFDYETGCTITRKILRSRGWEVHYARCDLGCRGATTMLLNLSGWIDSLGWQCEVVRGVSANHPEIANARNGVVKPGNVNSTISEETHNLGGVSGDGPFASWTRDPKVAKWWAEKDGPGGVVLGTPQELPSQVMRGRGSFLQMLMVSQKCYSKGVDLA